MLRIFPFLCLFILVSCKANKASEVTTIKLNTDLLINTWYLLEVTGDQKMFSSVKGETPSRMAYEKLHFQVGGKFSQTYPGPTDIPKIADGSWVIESSGILKTNTSLGTDSFQILELTSTKLLLKKSY